MVTERDLELSTGSIDSQALRLIKLADLSNINRFDGENFDGARMIHQTTLNTHEARTKALLFQANNALRAAGVDIDNFRAGYVLGVHDDHEVLTKDIPSPVKLMMSSEEREQLRNQEEAAIRILVERYMLAEFHDLYLELWHEAQAKETPEAQAADIADKWDGVCETLHEIRCSNTDFLEVLERYRSFILPRVEKHKVWPAISSHPHIQLDRIPTPGEADQLPKISLGTLRGLGYDAFWKEVFDPKLPEFYKRWMTATFRCGLPLKTPGTPLFPGWPNEGLEQDPKMYLLMVPHQKIR